MLFYNGKPHCVFSQLLFYCQVYARKTICLFVLSVYVCQNNEQNHVTVDTLPMWYLAHVKNKPVILRHLEDMWFIHPGLRPRRINHISPRCLKITLTYFRPKWRLLCLLSFKSFETWRIFSDIPLFWGNTRSRGVFKPITRVRKCLMDYN